jgi:hypothetical protein
VQKPNALTLDPAPTSCKGCGGKNFDYAEQFFTNEKYGITGHPDGFISLSNKEGYGVLEIKSISKNGAFEVKKAPKFEHIIQAQIYMWFTGLKWCCILYWDKGTFGTNALVEHFVDADPDTMTAVKETLMGIWHGIDSGKLPDRICKDNKCERAKECALAQLCFEKENTYDNKSKPV